MNEQLSVYENFYKHLRALVPDDEKRQGEQYDAVRCGGAVGRVRYAVTLTATLFSILVASSACALALDPSFDVSQYAHDAWRVQDGFTSGARLTSIAQTPDGYLWLGTDHGLYRFDGARNILWEPPPGQQLPSIMIWSLLAARDGTLWIGTDKGLVSWKDGKLTHYEGLARYYIFTILEDRSGVVWVSGIGIPTGRLCAIQTRSVHCYGEDGSFGTGVVGLYEDKQGNLWAGVMNGFWRWKPGPSIFYPVPDALDGIRAFVEGDDGALLFTVRSGIKRLMNGKIEPCSLPGNLQHLRVMRMLRDRDGGLWLGTWNRGIVHIHNRRSDADSNGLTGIDVVALFEDREGDIWAVTSTGLDRFREPGVNKLPPPVRIEQITADGKIYDALNGLRLPAHVRDLAIDYTALSLVAPEKIHFRYKLEGQDPNWREVVNDHRVQYSNLPPGDYRFSVTASNNSGIWNPTGASLNFYIVPAYYETVWFRALVTVAIAALLWALVTAIYIYRKDLTRKENERIERLRQAQTDLDRASRVITMGELAASLAHEIKQPIGAAVTNAEVCFRLLDRDQPDLPEARDAALEMMRDARRAADIIERVRSLYRKGSSAQEIVDVNEVIQEMVAMLQKEANRHSVRMSTDLTDGAAKVMADRVQLQQALMNLMLNGIEAMQDTTGELGIKSQLGEDGQLLISVSDTGVGLPTGKVDHLFDAFFTTKSQGTGLGLAITRSIVESHGGRIWANANSGPGATFQFTLPITEGGGR